MKKISALIVLGILTTLSGCLTAKLEKGKTSKEENNIVTSVFDPVTKGLIRNPGMGWSIYDTGNNDEVANATEYWEAQGVLAEKYASTLYLRWRWSDMEPEEGKYAWEYDENFKQLVQGALDRGLRLAFRVFVNSKDNLKPATPQFVFDAGAQGYQVSGYGGISHITPYPDDPIFREKFENFIKAFAEAFDDPEKVDYIDGYNLGWWGEGHNVKYKDSNNKEETFSWIINLYGNSFKKVPLIITLESVDLSMEKKYAYNGQGYSPRRDGYASYWFPERQKQLLRDFFPERMIVAEACYWGDRSIEYANNIDKKYSWNSWKDYYKQLVDEALSTHANYLDLREPADANRLDRLAKEEVNRFIEKGGYRIYLKQVSYKKTIASNTNINISHSWENLGVGVLPNNDKRWNYKYKVAFSLLNKEDKIVKQWLSDKAEPSSWINTSKATDYSESLDLENVTAGTYKLVTAIVDTTLENKPSINLAVDSQFFNSEGWLEIGDVTIKPIK